MSSLLVLAGPILAALVPLLLNRVTPLMERIFKHASSTKTGILGAGVIGYLVTQFPCLADMSAWQKVTVAAIPLIFGALSASKPLPKV